MSLDPFHPPPVQGAPEVNAVRGCVSSSPLHFSGYSHQTGMQEPGTLKQIFPSVLSLYGDHRGFVCSFSAPSAFLFFDSSCSLSSAPSLLCSHLFLVSLSLLGSVLLSSLVPLPPSLGQEPGPPHPPIPHRLRCCCGDCGDGSGQVGCRHPLGLPDESSLNSCILQGLSSAISVTSSSQLLWGGSQVIAFGSQGADFRRYGS